MAGAKRTSDSAHSTATAVRQEQLRAQDTAILSGSASGLREAMESGRAPTPLPRKKATAELPKLRIDKPQGTGADAGKNFSYGSARLLSGVLYHSAGGSVYQAPPAPAYKSAAVSGSQSAQAYWPGSAPQVAQQTDQSVEGFGEHDSYDVGNGYDGFDDVPKKLRKKKRSRAVVRVLCIVLCVALLVVALLGGLSYAYAKEANAAEPPLQASVTWNAAQGRY